MHTSYKFSYNYSSLLSHSIFHHIIDFCISFFHSYPCKHCNCCKFSYSAFWHNNGCHKFLSFCMPCKKNQYLWYLHILWCRYTLQCHTHTFFSALICHILTFPCVVPTLMLENQSVVNQV